MNSLVGHVALVRQSRPTTCVQACVSMLTGVSERKVCEALGKWGASSVGDAIRILRALGAGRVRVGNLTPIAEVEGFVPCGLVYVWPWADAEHGHLAVWVGDGYLCPTNGEMDAEEAWHLWAACESTPDAIVPVEILEAEGCQ
ncbi:hypothetical protein MYSTI_01911 [Myxococcus stipitatus DSM 14675]|uniref:Peptidase C39 domain-containing protein n=1 Tax=Myxococcus stipitatus (strain DSM 14675 / JCM 12634 / Mx s8) TaxID=1278073 RepID=L7U6M2_MYXSD|nr:hypothetical protein [Myxococcus stipitatus]AGC43242.1 hypothetical protein MYSTI_01911 [Myxococcus stipitatus DSM 14675]